MEVNLKKNFIRVITCLIFLVVMVSAMTGSVPGKKGTMREKLTSKEVVKLMGNGINLGNTMEAYGRKVLGTDAKVSSYETFWGQPITTQKMITGMKEAGFDSLRIPVAWTNMMKYDKGDYTINKAYLDRVEEIVNYSLEAKMYVIINDHWDGSWWGMFGSASKETRDKAFKLYTSMWTQIADRFKDYSDYVIFESANEELGARLNDVDVAKDSGTLSEDECYKMMNKINQTFVDTIRANGGNNKQRILLIAGYNTDIRKTCDDRFIMPKDTMKNKLIVSVHYYEPGGYTMNASITNWGSEAEFKLQNDLLSKMTKFTKMGYGVIIGEWAVGLKADGSFKPNTLAYINNLLDNCDKYGYSPMLWDCNSLFDRNKASLKGNDLAKLFKSRNVDAQSKMTDKEIVSKATKALNTALEKAKDYKDLTLNPAGDNKAIAWLMYQSGDYSLVYSVGDVYTPSVKSDGLVATDVTITGKGTYTVGLDFTGTAKGYAYNTSFMALGIANGELLYPGYSIDILDVKVNGKSYKLTCKPYTTSDDKKCTRVNLYNAWVIIAPKGANTAEDKLQNISATVVDPKTLGDKIKTITVEFKYSR
jgi:endoglucanase